MSRQGGSARGFAGEARLGKLWTGKAGAEQRGWAWEDGLRPSRQCRQGKVTLVMECLVEAGLAGQAWLGWARRVMLWQRRNGKAGLCESRFGLSRQASLSESRHGWERLGVAGGDRRGSVCLAKAWQGIAGVPIVERRPGPLKESRRVFSARKREDVSHTKTKSRIAMEPPHDHHPPRKRGEEEAQRIRRPHPTRRRSNMSETNEIVAKVTEAKRELRPTRKYWIWTSKVFGASVDSCQWHAAPEYLVTHLTTPDALLVTVPGELEIEKASRIEQARDAVIQAAKRLSQADTPDEGAKATRDIDVALATLATQENAK